MTVCAPKTKIPVPELVTGYDRFGHIMFRIEASTLCQAEWIAKRLVRYFRRKAKSSSKRWHRCRVVISRGCTFDEYPAYLWKEWCDRFKFYRGDRLVCVLRVPVGSVGEQLANWWVSENSKNDYTRRYAKAISSEYRRYVSHACA